MGKPVIGITTYLVPAAWGAWTASVPNYQATAEEVLGGMKNVKIEKREFATN